jgi:apurinic endonuclease APN1
MPPIGHHMQITSTVADTLRLINTLGGSAVQISLGSPSEKQIKAIDVDDARITNKIVRKHKFYIIVHGKFLYNFCRSGSSVNWQKKMLVQELSEANKIHADVIIHQGKNVKELGLTKEQAHQNFADNVNDVAYSVSLLKNKIILENSARQGTECGYSLDDLVDIHQKLDESILHKIGYCIDLCHIFVAGELDVRKHQDVTAWFERFDHFIGMDKLTLIHFNDSNTEFNGANDNHGPVPTGYIGRKSVEGFKVVCRLAVKHDIPLMLETPSDGMQREMTLLKEWIQ